MLAKYQSVIWSYLSCVMVVSIFSRKTKKFLLENKWSWLRTSFKYTVKLMTYFKSEIPTILWEVW